jgi:3-hydroxyacyl-CoA dehydrogenase
MTTVSVRREGVAAVVTIDNPPVNATSAAVREGLLAAVAEVEALGVDLAVLACPGRTFVAGGDVAEFDRPPVPPHLPDVLDAIERSAVPWCAALHGTVLGGGFELALACAWRVAAPGTVFGLPEVTLGLVPGAGGTQRLPRLIGMERAARLAATGERVTAARLAEWGGVDAILDGPLVPAALTWPAGRPRPRPLADREVAPEDLSTLADELSRTAKGTTAPLRALEAVGWSSLPFAEGLRRERALFLELRDSREARALRHAFFAERAVMRPAAIEGVAPRPIERVAVIGGGLMGAGIAAACLAADLPVVLVERDPAAATAAHGRVADLLAGAVRRGKATEAETADRLARLTATDDIGAAAATDIAIEAVFEDLAAKRAVFARLVAVLDGDALLATNTSYLDPDAIAEGLPRPDRVLGLHFFSPAHVMRLVEVVRARDTSPATLATGFGLVRRLGKVGVLARVCDGFIGNRILTAYRRAADYLLADGALPHEIDAAMRGFGMPMGPYELQDLTGLGIAYATRRRLDPVRPATERYVPIADRLVEAGRTGQAAGLGWYRYADGGRTPERDPAVEDMVRAWSAEEGVARRAFPPDEIVARLASVMVNEGAAIVEDGIAEGPDAVDVVEILGYGFPRWRGGPMHWAAAEGLPAVAAAMGRVIAQSPGSWRLSRRLTEALPRDT